MIVSIALFALAATAEPSRPQATFRATARIIAKAARIGPSYPAPEGSKSRNSTIAAANGQMVPAVIYDFE